MSAALKIRNVARAIEARETQERASVARRIREAARARSLAPIVAWTPEEIAWFRHRRRS